LITSTLQQQASAAFGMAPKVTMQVAQKLYEEGYITYMRTDSVVLSEDARTSGRAWIEETYGSEYLGALAEVGAPKKSSAAASKKKKEDTGAQEAHEAIRPTEMSMREIPEADALGSQERRLYGLIWR
jgi:DNA topoisomerase-1